MKLLSGLIACAFLALLAQVCTCLQTPTLEFELESNEQQQKPEDSLNLKSITDSSKPADQVEDFVSISKEPPESGRDRIADEAYSEDTSYGGSAIGYVEDESSSETVYKSVASKEREARKAVLRSLGSLVALVMGTLSMLLIVIGQPAVALSRGEYDQADELLDHITLCQFFTSMAVLILGLLATSAVLLVSFIRAAVWVVRLGNRMYAAARKNDEPREHQVPEATSDVAPQGGAPGGATGPVQR